MRKAVLVVAAVILLVGISQLFFGGWWLSCVRAIVDSNWFVASGIVALAAGIILLVAAAAREVSLRQFVVVIGLLAVLGGVLILAATNAMRSFTYAFFLDASAIQQKLAMWGSGTIRVIIGIGLLLALRKPRQTTPPAPPLEPPPA